MPGGSFEELELGDAGEHLVSGAEKLEHGAGRDRPVEAPLLDCRAHHQPAVASAMSETASVNRREKRFRSVFNVAARSLANDSWLHSEVR